MKKNQNQWSFLSAIIGTLLLLTGGCEKDKEEVKIKDGDGNVYNSVVIGEQTWLTENLKTTEYIDGTEIEYVTNGSTWAALTTPGYCCYNNDKATYAGTYGVMYNWHAVNGGDLCPIGWHVATLTELQELIAYLGADNAADKLKEAGIDHWGSLNTAATNETGFTALGGGARESSGSYIAVGSASGWWLADEVTSSNSNYFILRSELSSVIISTYYKTAGLYVRCIKD